jgi:hypothetical protein
MTTSGKAIGTLIVAVVAVGVAINFLGLPSGSTAGAANSSGTLAVSISPEELTRSAGPMPVQEIESYH